MSALRQARPWLVWNVADGEFYATKDEALANRPDGATQLLWQLRFDDDGSLIGLAFPADEFEVPA